MDKKIRFEVFKRDGFKCAYCGKAPPEVALEVDHITPKSQNGTSDINNLLTACFDCNRGKKAIPLDKIPNQLTQNLEILKEKEAQIKEYEKFTKKIREREDEYISKLCNVYTTYFPEWVFSESFREATLRRFVRRLPFDTILDFLHTACSRKRDKDLAIPYFCGICWNGINPDRAKKTYYRH